MRESIAFIINPKSGVERNKKIVDKVHTTLGLRYDNIKIAYTERKNDGARLGKELVEAGYKCIIIVGGDGSINDVVQGILHEDVTIGIIPMGSGNGLARSLGIPFDISQAVSIITNGRSMLMDIGLANGRPFVSNVGVGFDCIVSELFSKSTRRGLLSYASISATSFWKYKPRAWRVSSDKETKKGRYMLLNVCNIAQFGYNFYTAPLARADDGKLHILRIKAFPKILSLPLVIYAFGKVINRFRYTRLRSATRVSIEAADRKPFIYQADGDIQGEVSHLDISLLPQKLRILIP